MTDEQLAEIEARCGALLNSLEAAWVIIANAGHGDWASLGPDWHEAAKRWRDKHWHRARTDTDAAAKDFTARIHNEALEQAAQACALVSESAHTEYEYEPYGGASGEDPEHAGPCGECGGRGAYRDWACPRCGMKSLNGTGRRDSFESAKLTTGEFNEP